MSHEGKMKRGLKWYSQRNNNGELPKGIAEDPWKMCDVEYYLENKVIESTSKKKGGK